MFIIELRAARHTFLSSMTTPTAYIAPSAVLGEAPPVSKQADQAPRRFAVIWSPATGRSCGTIYPLFGYTDLVSWASCPYPSTSRVGLMLSYRIFDISKTPRVFLRHVHLDKH
jgi:hypothetical protein